MKLDRFKGDTFDERLVNSLKELTDLIENVNWFDYEQAIENLEYITEAIKERDE